MLRFLLEKFRNTKGPLKDARLVAADVAEEMLDLVEYYMSRALHRTPKAAEDYKVRGDNLPNGPHEAENAVVTQDRQAPPAKPIKPKKRANQSKPEVKGKKEPNRLINVPDVLAQALDKATNRKKQEFKVLAILWDLQRRDVGPLSAKEISEHGMKLGLSIRHENVRKVIRMRLEKQVSIITRQSSSGSIYHYGISEYGNSYFRSKYLENVN